MIFYSWTEYKVLQEQRQALLRCAWHWEESRGEGKGKESPHSLGKEDGS